MFPSDLLSREDGMNADGGKNREAGRDVCGNMC